ncbi:hypothetical protein ACF0H5_016525 [Mactra antiquata]
METLKQLIIIADDFGYSDKRDEGIIECFKTGAITGVSLMVNGYSAERAVTHAKNVGLPLDLHLNLTEGRPLSNDVGSFTNDNGFMLGKMGFREAIYNGLVDLKEIKQEMQAQIDIFYSMTGFKPVKVDGHQHVHIIPGISEIFAQTLSENQIPYTRLPYETGIIEHDWRTSDVQRFKIQLVEQSVEAAKIYTKYNIKYPYFIGLKTMGQDMSVQRLQQFISDVFNLTSNDEKSKVIEGQGSEDSSKVHKSTRQRPYGMLKAGAEDTSGDVLTCELMSHPGKVTGNVGGCGAGPDMFSQSYDRKHEMNILCSPEMISFYSQKNIFLVSFASLAKKIVI